MQPRPALSPPPERQAPLGCIGPGPDAMKDQAMVPLIEKVERPARTPDQPIDQFDIGKVAATWVGWRFCGHRILTQWLSRPPSPNSRMGD